MPYRHPFTAADQTRDRTNSSRPDRYRRAAKDQRCGTAATSASYQPEAIKAEVSATSKQGGQLLNDITSAAREPNAGGGGRSERRLSAPQIGAGYTFTGAGWLARLFSRAPRQENRLAESFRRGRRSFGRCGVPRSRIGRAGARHSFGAKDLCVGTVRPCSSAIASEPIK